MSNILRNILIGVVLLVVVVGYTYYETSKNAPANPEAASLGSDMPLDKLSENETVPKEKLSKTDVYLKDEYEKEEKDKAFARMIDQKSPEKLTSTFESVYKTENEKTLDKMKERDLTPSYTPSSGQSSSTDIFADARSVSSKSNNGTPKIMKSSVPTNRKTELQVQKAEVVSDESYFNRTSASDEGNSQTIIHDETTMVKAAVMGKQEVKAGGVMRFRLMEKATFGGTEFQRNTVFYAKCSFGQDRLFATVEKIPTKEGYKTVKLVLHDMDLMEGISAPVNQGKEAAMDETMNGVEDVLTSTGTVVGQAGSGIAKIFRSSTNGTQKVSVTDAYPVLFLISQ